MAANGGGGGGGGVLVLTAFTTDYLVGHLSAAVNREWAAAHGYDFRCDALPLKEILERIGPPRTAPTWYKVWAINELLREIKQVIHLGPTLQFFPLSNFQKLLSTLLIDFCPMQLLFQSTEFLKYC